MRSITFVDASGQRHVLRWRSGQEDAAADQLGRWADDPDHPLDWKHASVMVFAVRASRLGDAA